ncbi:hypothetical protein Nepgr_001849 [Nepenthes gracilis]|uniref:Uncharacterized protein n=1 Tax=Nepenthes gracilis TaxID=150966 RepID=A0AAD3P6V5_NEPGR|nr:hypothetical protein Nepgr_001849 [Nepenthes gracilis]
MTANGGSWFSCCCASTIVTVQMEVAAVVGKNPAIKYAIRLFEKLRIFRMLQNLTANTRGRPTPQMNKDKSQKPQERKEKCPILKKCMSSSGKCNRMEECEDVMMSKEKTLRRLQRLQSTSSDLPKEKVHLIFAAFPSLKGSFALSSKPIQDASSIEL